MTSYFINTKSVLAKEDPTRTRTPDEKFRELSVIYNLFESQI